MFAWVWLYILQSQNSAESVNPGTLCDGGVLRAQHSPPRGRLLFIPVMSILLGISASLHTTCCAQQCGEARASRVVVIACQSQSQGSVSSHQSDKAYPDAVCLPSPHVLPPTIGCPSSITCLNFLSVYHKLMLVGTYSIIILFLLCNSLFEKKWKEIYNLRKKVFNLRGDCFCVCVEVLGKRAVRGDKKVTPQYTLAAGKQTQHIDYIIFTDTQSSLWLMFTWHEVNSALDCRLLLCISFEAVPPVYAHLWPVPTPNFPHHIQSRAANGQLHYSQYLKSPLMCFPLVWSLVSSESQSFKCSCADWGCRW